MFRVLALRRSRLLLRRSRLLRRRANARNISYTPYPTGEKHTISTFVDQTRTQLTHQRRNRQFLSKTSLPVLLKMDAQVLRTGSGQNGLNHGSEPFSSPASVGQSRRENLERCGGEKSMRAPWAFPFKLARTSSFRLARPDIQKLTLVALTEI